MPFDRRASSASLPPMQDDIAAEFQRDGACVVRGPLDDAEGPEGLEIVAVGGPKPEGGDGETAPVDWPG
jgi:hypothetical protein